MFDISKLRNSHFNNYAIFNFDLQRFSNFISAKILLYFTLIFYCFNSIEAQSKNNNPTPKEFIVKVSQFGQFVKRFNYDEDFWGKPITQAFSKKINRSDYVSLLFNADDKRLDSTSSGFSKEYSSLKRNFISSVINNNYKINRISDSLYTDAICEVIYHNKPAIMHLFLKQENISNGIAWVIVDAKADFIYDTEKQSPRNFIPPTSNEVNYIHLNSLFEKKDSLASFAYPGYACNRLSIFFQLISSGDLQYKHVNYIRYFVNDIPGWIICIKEYNRDGMNSGWLIENLYRKKASITDFLRNESNFNY